MNFYQQLMEDGFVVLENFFSDEQIQEYSLEVKRALEVVRASGKEEFADNAYFDSDSSIFLIGDLSEVSEYWADLSHFKSLFPIVAEMLEDSAYQLEFMQVLIKNPNSTRQVGWHRDFPNRAIPRTDSRSVRTLICLDHQEVDNGGIRIVKNSHLVSDEDARLHRPAKEKTWNPEDEMILKCPRGSLIALHSKLIHSSGPNLTAFPRSVVTFSWAHSQNPVLGQPICSYSLLGTQPALRPAN